MAKRVFVSFAEEDVKLRDYFIDQTRNAKIPYEFYNMSVKEPWDKKWKTNCRTMMKGCSGMIVIVTSNTTPTNGQIWEVNCAKEERIPRRGIWGSDADRPAILPSELGNVRIVNWTIDNIKSFLELL
ncbi:MAG: hypothetical protein HYV28_17815 [Ignavibacteriales bacterium]|nr:hypothetical protein [Ignavibacteriales bacterium]MBI5726301.1 hypothetical protein [Ignavibacteriales bacterium]